MSRRRQLVRCRDCGGAISRNARACPRCGRARNAAALGQDVAMAMGIGLLVLIILLAIGMAAGGGL